MITIEQAMAALGYPALYANETEEPACQHDVGVFVGYDEQGNQMWKCTICGEISVD